MSDQSRIERLDGDYQRLAEEARQDSALVASLRIEYGLFITTREGLTLPHGTETLRSREAAEAAAAMERGFGMTVEVRTRLVGPWQSAADDQVPDCQHSWTQWPDGSNRCRHCGVEVSR